VKAKKNRQFPIKIERKLADEIREVSEKSRLTAAQVIRLCVERQLAEKRNLKEYSQERKVSQFSVRFEDGMINGLGAEARRAGLPLAEIIRLCLVLQLKKILADGSITISLDSSSRKTAADSAHFSVANKSSGLQK
jgi:hypothetical protein